MHRLLLKYTKTVRQCYQEAIIDRGLKDDQRQRQLAGVLDQFHIGIARTHTSWLARKQKQGHDSQNKQLSYFQKFFRKEPLKQPQFQPLVKSMYVYGGSGCGKSLLCDMFYTNVEIKEKKRVHFHQFMAQIHADLFHIQQKNRESKDSKDISYSKKYVSTMVTGQDPLSVVARNTAAQTRLLYLDEFQVTNVADASILRRLFHTLLTNDLLLLATSNRHPKNLYLHGHQRQFFLPFIDFLQQYSVIHNVDSTVDYRWGLESSAGCRSYVSPIDRETDQYMEDLFRKLAGGEPKEVQLEALAGRTIRIKKHCNRVSMFAFAELVEEVMGDYDFRAICKHNKAVIVKHMRRIKNNQRDVSNRLIKFVDQAYFRGVKVYISAEVGIDDIISIQGEPCSEEDFALIRCLSRLKEFQSKEYRMRISQCQSKDNDNNK